MKAKRIVRVFVIVFLRFCMLGRMLIRPDSLLRLEALLVAVIAVMCYVGLHESWLLFVVLFLVPGVSLLG